MSNDMPVPGQTGDQPHLGRAARKVGTHVAPSAPSTGSGHPNTTMHTPGPWNAGHLGRPDISCECRYILSEGYAGSIAEVSVGNGKPVGDGGNDAPPYDEAVANMRLIAAAPDLLEACRLALNMAETDQGPPNWDILRHAIAKAEGRAS